MADKKRKQQQSGTRSSQQKQSGAQGAQQQQGGSNGSQQQQGQEEFSPNQGEVREQDYEQDLGQQHEEQRKARE